MSSCSKKTFFNSALAIVAMVMMSGSMVFVGPSKAYADAVSDATVALNNYKCPKDSTTATGKIIKGGSGYYIKWDDNSTMTPIPASCTPVDLEAGLQKALNNTSATCGVKTVKVKVNATKTVICTKKSSLEDFDLNYFSLISDAEAQTITPTGTFLDTCTTDSTVCLSSADMDAAVVGATVTVTTDYTSCPCTDTTTDILTIPTFP